MVFDPYEELKDIPCSFNLTTVKKVSREKFKHIRRNIERDLEDSITSEEKVRILNLQTLVLFNLKKEKEAFKKNAEALDITNRLNLTALGNHIFLLFNKGEQIDARLCFCNELQSLANQETFDQLKTEARAEQAYSYIKLAGFQNIQLCIQLFEECVEKYPENYLWKYSLGLAYRRLTNCNLHSSHEAIDVKKMAEECARMLFDVAENGDLRLRGLAYAQLVELRKYSNHPEPEVIFKDLDKMQLLKMALENDSKNYVVLTMCGMGIKKDDLDRAIELLRRSAGLRDYSMTLHHLGLCLLEKARLLKSLKKDEPSGGAKEDESLPGTENSCPNQERSIITVESDSHTTRDNVFKSTPLGIKRMCSVDSSIEMATLGISHLDITDPLILEAISSLEKSFDVSHQTNIPAKISLGELYMDLHDFQKALAQYNIIIGAVDSDYLLSQITAHENAGKCLKLLDGTQKQNDSSVYKVKANEHFKKALSLAVDLSSRNPIYRNCETEVWDAFKLLFEDVKQIPTPKERYKAHIKLLDLAQNQDIAKVINDMLEQGLELDDIEMFHTGLKSYLKNKDYEGALAFLNIACTNNALIKNDLWKSSDVSTTKVRTYISAAWWRLMNDSPDSRRVFQQMFQMRYGHCFSMASSEEVETELKKSDVLLVNDISTNTEDGPDVTTILARKLTLVLKLIFGLDTSYIEVGLC